ncbi:MAG: DUF4044 domain-containing protein [Lactobacillus sp.]|uniref:DUF4044 domain-containing protein n=1 Tax=Lacticaseibacillus suilingensis TaxID=2799577 RepID=A0ABW4BI38_9LACO|nr:MULTISPECIES: DUF4044 domain-containing protein [Lacticaseibacillus]MCI1894422.1 DUF4044 domain-containing protein [Lactobacillus sp.]MCI1916994.1 DUF4044 domain-containing protein [Lactobacillus sp.]MCI1941757.1 DUF4044 domain-containing protein [Lactobacillus sp.]MCI1972306.1 DUF4044 domain-containing protein [Lactobacillus sp.]MCI2016846.1 DUF4044 domain-containing protein [Lactobacillus sp.]
MKQKRSKFWYITHIATWAMLIVTVFGVLVLALQAMGSL